jgi:putative ABC transport system substrate-binding protein
MWRSNTAGPRVTMIGCPRSMVGRQVTVLVATGSSLTALAAKAATTTIPIVFGIGGDPVELGLVSSFNRPGGNATGVYFHTTQLEGKRLGLLRELVPTAALIAVLLNPTLALAEAQLKNVQAAARTAGQQIHILRARSERELDSAFAVAAQIARRGTAYRGRSSSPAAITSSHWPRAMPCRRSTSSGSSPRPAAL